MRGLETICIGIKKIINNINIYIHKQIIINNYVMVIININNSYNNNIIIITKYQNISKLKNNLIILIKYHNIDKLNNIVKLNNILNIFKDKTK